MGKDIAPKLKIFLQTIVEPRFARIVACEAVTRLSGKDIANVSQDVFFPIAEKSGLSTVLGTWRFEEVCKIVKKLITSGVPFSYVSFDVLQKSLRKKTYIKELLQCATEHDIPPTRICLEIPEDYFPIDHDNIIERITELKKEGFKVAIDNYSGINIDLSKLDVVPIDIIKISKKIVDRLSFDEKAIETLGTIIAKAKTLGIRVQAEGVEKKEQQVVLIENGCNYMQGNLYGDLTTINAILKKRVALKAG